MPVALGYGPSRTGNADQGRRGEIAEKLRRNAAKCGEISSECGDDVGRERERDSERQRESRTSRVYEARGHPFYGNMSAIDRNTLWAYDS